MGNWGFLNSGNRDLGFLKSGNGELEGIWGRVIQISKVWGPAIFKTEPYISLVGNSIGIAAVTQIARLLSSFIVDFCIKKRH